MRPNGVIPTADSIRQIERNRRLQAAAGSIVACEVCGREYAPRIAFDVRYGRKPPTYIGAKTCSQTCAEAARRKAIA